MLSFEIGRQYERASKKGRRKIEAYYILGIFLGIILLAMIFLFISIQTPPELDLNIWK
jgi:hypothetical protein